MEVLASVVVAPLLVFQCCGDFLFNLREGFLEVEVTQVFEQLYHIVSFLFLASSCPQSSHPLSGSFTIFPSCFSVNAWPSIFSSIAACLYGWQCLLVSWLVHNFGPVQNISTTM